MIGRFVPKLPSAIPLRLFRPPHAHEPTKSCHRWRGPLFVLCRLPSPLSCAPDEHSTTSGTRLRPIMVTLRARSIRCRSRSPRSQGKVWIRVLHQPVLIPWLELHPQVRWRCYGLEVKVLREREHRWINNGLSERNIRAYRKHTLQIHALGVGDRLHRPHTSPSSPTV